MIEDHALMQEKRRDPTPRLLADEEQSGEERRGSTGGGMERICYDQDALAAVLARWRQLACRHAALSQSPMDEYMMQLPM